MSYCKPAGLSAALSCLLWLSACGGGGGSPTSSNFVVATAVSSSAPLASCPNGGITVDSGVDSNGNGVLDSSEVTNSQYVCHGAPGSNGTNGSNGANGANALVRMTDEAAGANCANGGKKIEAGLDANANSTLDAGEVASTAYVCNGATGANGSNGTNGTNGSNGLNTLMSIVSEAAGSNCAYGGNKITSGTDSNANGVLDSAEVTATSYVCHGAPAGIPWVDVTATAVQAQPNTGYIAHNDSAQVTVTLPTNPAFGDVVRVNGLGAGGWKIAQNAGQSINARNLGIQAGLSWTARESVRNWRAVASSADGSKLVAAVYGGKIYTSTDGGVSWTARESDRAWTSVASSADGSKLMAVAEYVSYFFSTDSGVTWTGSSYTWSSQWIATASSADGSKLVMAELGGFIYTSADSGATWATRASMQLWYGLASSADGSKLVAVTYGGKIYTSTDSGVTWTPRESDRNWYSVASSADGNKLVAVEQGGQIYTSTDSGVNWTAHGPIRDWLSVTSSADGAKLVAVAYGGQIHTSVDGGATWVARETNRDWRAVTTSEDGSKLVAMVQQGQIYLANDAIAQSIQTTSGTSGGILGDQYEALELQYLGNGTFSVLSSAGSFDVQ